MLLIITHLLCELLFCELYFPVETGNFFESFSYSFNMQCLD